MLTLIRSLLVVAVLEPSLPCFWLMLKMVRTKVIVALLGLIRTLTVSSLSQDSLEKLYYAPLLMMLILRLPTALLTMVMTTQTTLELLMASLHLFCFMVQQIKLLLSTMACCSTTVLRTKICLRQ